MWFVVARKRLPTPFALLTIKPNPTVIVLPVLIAMHPSAAVWQGIPLHPPIDFRPADFRSAG